MTSRSPGSVSASRCRRAAAHVATGCGGRSSSRSPQPVRMNAAYAGGTPWSCLAVFSPVLSSVIRPPYGGLSRMLAGYPDRMTWTAGDGPGPALGVHPPVIPPALTRKHGFRGVLFTLVVGVALLAGALVMAIVLVAVGRPEAVAIGLVLAILPVGPLVACYLWLDRYEPEPV